MILGIADCYVMGPHFRLYTFASGPSLTLPPLLEVVVGNGTRATGTAMPIDKKLVALGGTQFE